MKVHIGSVIEKKLAESGIKSSVFAQKLNMSNRNLYNLFKRSSVNSELLQEIGDILGFDFFSLYKNEEQSSVQEAKSKYARNYHEDKLALTVFLDGTDETLNMWIEKMQRLNAAI